MKNISATVALLAAFFIYSAEAAAKPPFRLAGQKQHPAEAADAADPEARPGGGLLMGSGGTAPYNPDLTGASAALQKLNADARTLYGDQAQLINRVGDIKTFFSVSATSLGLIETLATDLKIIETGLKSVDEAAEGAEAIPQAREKAAKLRASIKGTLADVAAARVRVDAVVTKTRPVRVKMADAADKLGLARLGLLGFNEGVVARLPFAVGIAAGCIKAMPADRQACAQGAVDPKAADVDSAVAEYDRVVKVLIYTPGPWLPSVNFFDPFSAELAELQKLRDDLEALKNRVEKMEDELRGLLKIMNMKFSFSFPYPNPSWRNPVRISHYEVKVKFSKIIKGSKAIEDEIEDILSGFLWGVLKKIGVGKFVDELKDDADREANRLMKAVHFDLDLGLPDFGPLSAFDASLGSLLPDLEALKLPVVDLSLPDFGLPGVNVKVPFGDIGLSLPFFSPNGLVPTAPNICAAVSYGCK